MKFFTRLGRLLLSRVHVTLTPRPVPLHMLPETIHADIYPQLAAPMGDAPADQLAKSLLVDDQAVQKPKRRKRKPKSRGAVMLAAPEPLPPTPPTPPWLENLRNKRRPRIDHDAEIERLPANTSVAVARDRTLYRQPGEDLPSFVTRIRAILGEGKVDWGHETPDKTRLDIIQSHLNRTIKADEDADFSGVLSEDLINYRPDHRVIH
jgi:hypothetical protein